jgi:hypothetical protein
VNVVPVGSLTPLADLPSPALSDEEAEAIRRKLAEGWRGPVLVTWLEQLLQDRDERVRATAQAGHPPHTPGGAYTAAVARSRRRRRFA